MAIKRIKKELYDLCRDPILTFSVSPLEDDLFYWHAATMGPRDSPYEDGAFLFNISILKIIHSDHQEVYHPNINVNGILLSIFSLLVEPDSNDPLRPEVAHVYKTDRTRYIATAREWTRKYAMDFES
ncbi:ubiquitin-conjugating enzyme/RWD-like protein [Glomus cerebriforme]|uniref:Ubiquitin-conjugating enzyme/RWD-like protein n=1 Tax=Glomus cerebriforme TaxID=658196 RepID=A0A397TGJ8_9GLOM|nr:ubiquitin-conjugating enzyme/RWD-like protein [Glomus cerebriforme]